jgi:hypothetical protein
MRLEPFSYFWTCWNVSPGVRHICLAHIQHEPPHSQAAADMLVGGIDSALWHLCPPLIYILA